MAEQKTETRPRMEVVTASGNARPALPNQFVSRKAAAEPVKKVKARTSRLSQERRKPRNTRQAPRGRPRCHTLAVNPAAKSTKPEIHSEDFSARKIRGWIKADAKPARNSPAAVCVNTNIQTKGQCAGSSGACPALAGPQFSGNGLREA